MKDERNILGMTDFKRFGGEIISDLGTYVRDYIKENPGVRVFVGCDSKQLRKRTLYATVVAFYHDRNGAHIIFKRKTVPKERDFFMRIFREALYAMELAEYLDKELQGKYEFQYNLESFIHEFGHPKGMTREEVELEMGIMNEDLKKNRLIEVDLDINPSKLHKSNTVYKAAVGLVTGSQFRCRTKPNAWAASCAADLLCK